MRSHRTKYDLVIYMSSKGKASWDDLRTDFKGTPNALSYWLRELMGAGVIAYDKLEEVYRFVEVKK